ncbi:gamma-butyrobetaine hydroxylase-like domain-containing protein [Pseudomonas sp. CAN2814]|uniref:gamma-butyrobetaine hydroxylase-like domain-containing protein n=1 Tax=Pseudomonas sp. CAN1 TaxID=3046726 RepID=UPI002647A7EF|nr:gamma-butyrobetaine hydroxylase-like domain-containing protein [Pseudomonas sp. CAN1]MDN6860318.1 gamma-butyrobetaine hydroxylase-like domain-containing protein [Pseudomonas sp. CAN1]
MITPVALHRSSADRELRIRWDDGVEQCIAFARLRGACPCSQCRAARLQGRIELVAAEVVLQQLNLQGYGVQLVFDDGHDRGIYPWEYLRNLC